VEKLLMRALAVTDPENEPARRVAADALCQQPSWFEHLGAFSALQSLANREARDPMDVVDDPGQRALLAETLLAETRPPEASEVASAIQEIRERMIVHRVRDLRALLTEAERRGDHSELAVLLQEKFGLDRALQKLHRNGDGL
jgi:DNA primase